MAPIPQPKPLSVAPFQPDPNAQSFAEIFDQEIGNLGTSSDGFDSVFADMVTSSPPGAGNDTILGPAQANLADVNTAVGNGPLRTFRAKFASALAAGVQKFNTLAGTVGPDGQPIGTVTGGGTTPTPTPTPKPTTCVAPSDNPATILPDMTVGDPADQEFIDSYQSPTDPQIRVTGYCGDPAIFSVVHQNVPGGYGSQVGGTTQHEFYMVISPTKAGTFTGAYTETDDVGNVFQGYYTVTIKPKASTGPQPIGPGQFPKVTL